MIKKNVMKIEKKYCNNEHKNNCLMNFAIYIKFRDPYLTRP